MFRLFALLLLSLCVLAASGVASVGPAQAASKGQTLYVPCYSFIYHGDKKREYHLTVTLSVRNTDLTRGLKLESVDYYDGDGQLVRSFLKQPMTLKALVSREFVINRTDRSGGAGANFIVRWSSEQPVNEPLVEAVMIGTYGQQGISFVGNAVVVE